MREITFTRWLPGFYKANLGKDAIGREMFTNIRKKNNKWEAEIRYASNGEIARFAGIWGSLKEAKGEITRLAENYE